MKKIIGIVLLTLSLQLQAGKNFGLWLVDSEIKRNPSATTVDYQSHPKWGYSAGLELYSIYQAGVSSKNQKYIDYAVSYTDTLIDSKGIIKGYEMDNFNIDQVNAGKLVFMMYHKAPDQRLKNVLDTLRQQMRLHPRTSDGSFWHKKIYPHQVWLDGLYMAGPFLAEYAKSFNEPALFDDVALQILQVDKIMKDPKTGLYYHGWDESRQQKWSNPETGLSPNFWSRSMGWYLMATVDVMDFMPADHPARPQMVKIIKDLLDSLDKFSDAKTGMWYQVTNFGGKKGNYLESSGSAMFIYTMKKAALKGYLDKTYLKKANKLYKQFVKTFIEHHEDGTISVTNCCEVSGLGGSGRYRDGSFNYYISEPIRNNDAKTVGPFILMSLMK